MTYSLCDIVDNDGTIGISIVHRRQRFVSLLSCSIPNFELHGCSIIKGDSLCEKGSPYGRLSVIIELILGLVSDRPSSNIEDRVADAYFDKS